MNPTSFAVNLFFTMSQSGLIMDAAAMEADMADFGGGAPPESELTMIHEMWYELVSNPYPCLQAAEA
jgi:hypothetical protein